MAVKTTKLEVSNSDRIYQGDILKDVICLDEFIEDDKQYQINYYRFPLVYVLSQECDLVSSDLDSKSELSCIERGTKCDLSRRICSVLVTPLYNEVLFQQGTHLLSISSEIYKDTSLQDAQCKRFGSDEMKYIKDNHRYRYHFLKYLPASNMVNSVIDFSHFFTVSYNSAFAKKLKDSTPQKLKELYREEISIRFSQFLSRIGFAPED